MLYEPADIIIHIQGRGIVLKDKSVLAYQKSDNKIVAFGTEAECMANGNPENILVTSPLRQGKIADYHAAAAEGFEVSYVVLRPDEESTVLRAANREQRESFPLVSGDVRKVWKFFAELNEYEENVVDTTGQIPEESAELIQRLLREGRVRLQV